MATPEETLRGFVEDSRHLTTNLNMLATDMMRNKDLVRRFKEDPRAIATTYNLNDEETNAVVARDLLKLYYLGLHPFLLARFSGMLGILEHWQELGAPGRRDQK